MEPFTDPVGLGVPRLGARVVDVLHGKIQFVLVTLRRPAVLRAAVGEDPVQRNLVLVEEWQYPIIAQVRGGDRGLPVIEFREPHLAVGVDDGLLIDPAHALQAPDIERVLCAAVARTFALKFAMRFFVGLRLLQRNDLRLGQHEALLSDLGLQGLEPFPHGLQIMPEPDAPDARGGDRQGSFAEFVRHA